MKKPLFKINLRLIDSTAMDFNSLQFETQDDRDFQMSRAPARLTRQTPSLLKGQEVPFVTFYGSQDFEDGEQDREVAPTVEREG